MATAIPLRLQILRAITSALEDINPTNGYEFDLRPDSKGRPRVVRGELVIGDDEPLPMVTLMEPPMAVEGILTKRQPDNTKRVGEWDLIIQGWVQRPLRGPESYHNLDPAYQLMEEVRLRLAKEKAKSRNGRHSFFGFDETKITNMTIGAPVVRPNEHISEQAVFYLILTLDIVEDMANPLR